MSYEKHTWQTGEVITADKLNNLEAGVESGQNGYEITDTYTTLIDTLNIVATNEDEYNPPYYSFDQSNFTEEGYEFINNKTGTETLRITFDGEEYLVVGNTNTNNWGASSIWDEDTQTESWDWSEYPFFLYRW